MKEIFIHFEEDKNSDRVEIIVRASEKDNTIKKLMEHISEFSSKSLTVYDNKGAHCVVNENDIIFVSANGKQVHIVTSEGFYYAKERLHSIEKFLNDDRFLRISRFEIINLKKVRKYDFTIGGSFRIEFENGMEVWASRRYISIVKKRLSGEEGAL